MEKRELKKKKEEEKKFFYFLVLGCRSGVCCLCNIMDGKTTIRSFHFGLAPVLPFVAFHDFFNDFDISRRLRNIYFSAFATIAE